MSKFLEFRKVKDHILVMNKKSKAELGKISYFEPWKKMVFEAAPEAVFSIGCLHDIIHMMRINQGD